MTDLRSQFGEWLRLAEHAAEAGASVLHGDGHAEPTVIDSAQRDVKLDVDRRAEELIVAELRRQSDLPILTEERGDIAGEMASGLKWIVDPLDGSFNFLRNIPFCCVSVALLGNDRPMLGAIYDFNAGEMFSGIVGEGAWLNGAAICVSGTRTSSQAVFATGFPVGSDFRPDALQRVVEQVVRFKKIRLLGSAALSLAYVAAGRIDAYGERGIRLWDVAAGLAIVEAAGGKLSRTNLRASDTMDVYAHNGWLTPSEAGRAGSS